MYKSKKPRNGTVLIMSYKPSRRQGSIRIFNLGWGRYLSPLIKIDNVKDKEALIERGLLIALKYMCEFRVYCKIYCTDKALNDRIGNGNCVPKESVSFSNLSVHWDHLLLAGFDNCLAFWQPHWGNLKAEVSSIHKKESSSECDLPF